MSTQAMQMQVPVLLGEYATRREAESPDWMWATDSPKAEAKALFSLIGRNGDTPASIRRMISVPDRQLTILVGFANSEPAERPWVMRALLFRSKVLREFDRLVNEGSVSESQGAENTEKLSLSSFDANGSGDTTPGPTEGIVVITSPQLITAPNAV